MTPVQDEQNKWECINIEDDVNSKLKHNTETVTNLSRLFKDHEVLYWFLHRNLLFYQLSSNTLKMSWQWTETCWNELFFKRKWYTLIRSIRRRTVSNICQSHNKHLHGSSHYPQWHIVVSLKKCGIETSSLMIVGSNQREMQHRRRLEKRTIVVAQLNASF